MPVFLITIHAYRSWNADRPQGYVRRGEGILPPDKERAKAYDHNAVDDPAEFGPTEQRVIGWIVADAAACRGWRIHAAAIEAPHAHVLISWRDETRSASVGAKLKNLTSRELNRHSAVKRRWLSRGASRKQVKDRAYFEQLVSPYLPKHRGLVWVEGMPPIGPPPRRGRARRQRARQSAVRR